MTKRLLAFVLFSFSLILSAQNPDLKITLTGTAETCLNNGALSWTTSGNTPGASLTYSIFSIATSSVVTTTSDNSYTGLPTGSYRVIVTETTGAQSNQATSNDFNVLNQKVALKLINTVVQNEICGNDGSFELRINTGRAPFKFQLLNNANEVTREQSSPFFTGLTAGLYKFRVIDNCGTSIVGERTVLNTPSNLGYFNLVVSVKDCSNLFVTINQITGTVKYPLTVKIAYTNPLTGLSESVTEGNLMKGKETITMPYFPQTKSFTVVTTVTDACGRPFTQTISINQEIAHSLNKGSVSCGSQTFRFDAVNSIETIPSVFKVKFTKFPTGFDPVALNPAHGQPGTTHKYGFNTSAVAPAGIYEYELSDDCGRKTTGTFELIKVDFKIYELESANECGSNFHSLRIGAISGYNISESKITVAPAAFIEKFGALPFLVPATWYENTWADIHSFTLTGLPSGNYEIQATNTCDSTVAIFNKTFTPPISEPVRQVSIQKSCSGTFRLLSTTNNQFNFEIYFPSKGEWGIFEQRTHTPGSGNFSSTYILDTNKDYDFGPGRFRLVTTSLGYYVRNEDGSARSFYCDNKVLQEFVIGGGITEINAYAFECANGTYDVSVFANGGSHPFTYSIVDKESNDAVTIIDNGGNAIFQGLSGGIYYFRVTDNCGAFKTVKLDIALLGKPGIRFDPNCETNSLKLSIDNLDYLNFEWFKADNPSTILSTTSVLDLGVFTADKAGDYKVRLKATSPTSCVNSVLELKLTPQALTTANPGTGQTINITYNGTDTYLNLFNYLTGEYDGYGTWTELTSPIQSNLLVKNQWLIAAAQSGTYKFRYTVKGPCGGLSQFSEVIVNLIKVCYKPPVIGSAGDIHETTFGISSLGRAGEKGGNWPMLRKGGWLAMESNSKGFVVNRVSFKADGLPTTIPVQDFVEGMMVFDTTNQCMKIYNGTVWSCFTTQTCPE